MPKVYLFDWGDTLMVDFEKPGSMCEWEVVQACEGANEVLAYLSLEHKIYVATGAGESSEEEIKRAFERVDLARYIDGYFCQSNVGIPKGTPDFLKLVLEKIIVRAQDAVMVGDRMDKDIKPALSLGMNAVWISDEVVEHTPPNLKIIHHLKQLMG